jgi:hypothetical protein
MSPETRLPIPEERSEENETKLERELGERYDTLLAERRELAQELGKYDIREFDVIFAEGAVERETLDRATAECVDRIRKRTSFLRSVDKVGIDIFASDLKRQAGFPDHEIIFKSGEILRKRVTTGRHVGGQAHAIFPKIEIAGPEPSVASRMGCLLLKGGLPQEVETLVHELIHRYHDLRNEGRTNEVLTEAQAYFSGPLSSGTDFGIKQTAEKLTMPESEGGLYEYDPDQTVNALSMMAELYGLGLDDGEIGDLVAQSKYVRATGSFEPMASELRRLKEERGVEDDADVMALYDLFRLHSANERMKVRLTLFRTYAEFFPREQRLETKRRRLQKVIGYPKYEIDGIPVPSHEMRQGVVLPMNDEYPYEMDGLRTGITFGLFPTDGRTYQVEGGNYGYRIGRWEAEGQEGHVELAVGEDEEREYLASLGEAMAAIGLEHKLSFFTDMFSLQLVPDGGLADRVAKVMLQNSDERKEITKKILEEIEPELDLMIEQLDQYLRRKIWTKTAKKNVGRHEAWLVSCLKIRDTFDLPFKEVSEGFAKKISLLEGNIDAFKKMAAEKEAGSQSV